MTYMSASNVERSAHCTSSTMSTTCSSWQRRASQSSNRTTTSPVVGIEVDHAGRVESLVQAAQRRSDREHRESTSRPAAGTRRRSSSEPARPAHARATRAVLPTPASPATTSVCASSAAERSRSVLTVPSSRSRPTNTGANGSGWHGHGPSLALRGARESGFSRGISGGRPDSAGPRCGCNVLPSAFPEGGKHHVHRTHASAHPCSSSPRERSLATAAAGSATARPESAPEPPAVQSARLGECPLERIGRPVRPVRRPDRRRCRGTCLDSRAVAASAPGQAQNGSSGSIPIARKSSDRYAIEPWNTRIGDTCSWRIARL